MISLRYSLRTRSTFWYLSQPRCASEPFQHLSTVNLQSVRPVIPASLSYYILFRSILFPLLAIKTIITKWKLEFKLCPGTKDALCSFRRASISIACLRGCIFIHFNWSLEYRQTGYRRDSSQGKIRLPTWWYSQTYRIPNTSLTGFHWLYVEWSA